MEGPGETFKHGKYPVEKLSAETFSTTTHEPPVVDPIWKVTRLLETVYVRGRTQTQAYENAAKEADAISLVEFFSVPVLAVKTTGVQQPRSNSAVDSLPIPATDDSAELEIESPYYGD
jgi:hypothetical protein